MSSSSLVNLASVFLIIIFSSKCFAQSSSGDVVAIVEGKTITVTQVDELVLPQIFPFQQQLYALRKAALESLIVRSLLASEAKRNNVSTGELQKKLTSGPVVATNEQVKNLYLENASAFGAMRPDEARQRLRLDLESQGRMRNYRAAIAALREHSKVSIFLEEPRLRTTVADE